MRARRLGETLALDPAARHFEYMTALQGLRRERAVHPGLRRAADQAELGAEFRALWDDGTATDTLDHMLEVDTATYLPDDLLAKVDIATMAYSLEARSPLLDHELMQFAASLPTILEGAGAEKKIALRRAMRGIVPDEILVAPKQGFSRRWPPGSAGSAGARP